jgi:CRISPR/Cas system-associated exonuclease Cas4 (RecB family)
MVAAKSRKNLFDPQSAEPYAVSRSGISEFQACARCFWHHRRLGIRQPSMPSMTINRLIDALLKKEFDLCRASQRPHPAMHDSGIDAVPLVHPDLAAWRNPFKGVRHVHAESGIEAYGAPDDVWRRPNGEFIVCDYKALASKEQAISLDGHRRAYVRQVETYAWLLRKNGHRVSKTAYLLFANAVTAAPSLDGRLAFSLSLLPVDCDDSWIGPALLNIKDCLMLDAPPPASPDCELCAYLAAVDKATAKGHD